MSALRDWECAAHGYFEKRTRSAQDVPRCPKGCSKSLVKHVILQPVGTVSAGTRTSDRLVREMAKMQGLSDISTSPSRPGGTVAERNRARSQGAAANPYPPQFACQAPGGGIRFAGGDATVANLKNLGFGGENAMRRVGLGHEYDKNEWRTDKTTGRVKHVGMQPAIVSAPAASVDRVKEQPK